MQEAGYQTMSLYWPEKYSFGRTKSEQAIKVDSLRPVLVMTDCVDMKRYVDAMWLGATDYLEKPRSPQELLKTISRLLLFLGNCAWTEFPFAVRSPCEDMPQV